MPFMISTQLRLPLLMEAKCSLKLHQTFKCSRLHGVITNITTRLSFSIPCTPNGAVCYISPLYVGSISDVELTRVSGFIQKLEGRGRISRMADQGLTIKDMLHKIGVDLNIPPFLEGQKQLPAEEVKKGRQIASVRIHVECPISRIKNFSILKGTSPLSMMGLTNQIVCVCAWVSNFQPTLVPAPTELSRQKLILSGI